MLVLFVSLGGNSADNPSALTRFATNDLTIGVLSFIVFVIATYWLLLKISDKTRSGNSKCRLLFWGLIITVIAEMVSVHFGIGFTFGFVIGIPVGTVSFLVANIFVPFCPHKKMREQAFD